MTVSEAHQKLEELHGAANAETEKARRELGFEPGSVDGALTRAIEWFGSRCCS